MLSAAQAASGVHKENYQRLNAEYNEANHQHPSERKRYNAKQKEYERFTQLDLEKSRLEPQISKIRADLDVLKNNAFYSFMSIGVVGAVGLSAFLLVQFGVIAFIPPIAIVIAAVINIGVLALIFRAIIVGIQASSQQSELIKCRQTIDEQQIEIVENEETSCEFVNQDIPTLKRNIENLERQCQEQTKLKQEAEDTARVSFEKACVIQVSQPGNRFFPPAGTTQTEAVHRDGLAYNP